jgi:acetyltransferase
MPFIQGLPKTVRALQNLVRYAAAVRRGAAPAAERLDAPGEPATAVFETLMASHGLTLPRSARATTAEEAAAKAAEIGFPVALKIVSPQASHKTEIGGVALHLGDAAAVRAAADAMAARLLAHDPGATIDGFLIQEMVDGLEMLVGVREDAQFGPIMAVGLGGIAVEVMRDVAIRLLPVDEDTAREMIGSLRGAPLLGAFRGRPARDTDSLVRAMAGLSRLFLQYRDWLSDIEINPLIVLAQGVRAVDIRTVRRANQRRGSHG